MIDITNKKYKVKLVQVIDIEIRGTIDLEEGVYPTLNIIQKESQKKTQEICWIKLWSEIINRIVQPTSMNRPEEYFDQAERILFK